MSILNPAIREGLASASWIRRMFDVSARLIAQYGADQVYDFSLGNPHLEPPAAVLEKLKELAADPTPGMHRYMPNAGYPEVRSRMAQVVSDREGVTVPSEHVLMTCGAAGAINMLFRTLLGAGDEVLLFTPMFAEYRAYCQHAGAAYRTVPTTADFDLDLDRLAGALTPAIKVVVINSPNNPTGRVYPASTINGLTERLAAASRQFGRPIVLVSDDPYHRVVYDGVKVPALLPRYSATALVTSFSKDLGLAGERIGYLALHPEFPDAKEVLAGLQFCLRTLGFVNAPALMQRLVAATPDASVDLARYRENRDLLYGILIDAGYDVVLPQGSFFLFPKSPIADDVVFCDRLLHERIVPVPGIGFGAPGHFRLAYATPTATIKNSRAGFARALQLALGPSKPHNTDAALVQIP